MRLPVVGKGHGVVVLHHAVQGHELVHHVLSATVVEAVMGMDVDLNIAMSEATQEAVNFLQQQRNLSAGDAYALSSIATNFGISETVNHVRVIYGAIPKKIFSTNPPFWSATSR